MRHANLASAQPSAHADCCNFHRPCDQGRDCPVRHQRASLTHIDHRAGDTVPFTFTSPGDLEALFGPEHDFPVSLAWTLIGAAVLAGAMVSFGMAAGYAWAAWGAGVMEWFSRLPLAARLG